MRRNTDADILSRVTKQEVIDLFMQRIHPSSKTRSKLSVHMRAVPPAEPDPKFSLAAATALLPALKSRGVAILDENLYQTLATQEPKLSVVKGYWENHFKSLPNLKPESARELLEMADKLAKEFPSETEVTGGDEGKLAADVQRIQDMAAFKAGLTVSKAATPVTIYSDLDARL